jgi:RNA polymerase sigma-70 factor (sigma-E family)
VVGVQSSTSLGVDVAALYAAHRMGMIRLATLLVDDVGSAEDVVQDAFIGLTRHAHRLRDDHAALGYVRASVVNGSRSMLRRRRTIRTFLARATPEADAPAPDLDILRHDTNDEVLCAVRTLPRRMQEVLVLRYWAELSETEIARALGISAGTVKSTASRALDKLEAALGGTR